MIENPKIYERNLQETLDHWRGLLRTNRLVRNSAERDGEYFLEKINEIKRRAYQDGVTVK